MIRTTARRMRARCCAGRYLCQELGKNLTSAIGFTVAYDDTNGIRATRGQRIVLGQDFAGLGGDVKYLRTRLDAYQIFRTSEGICPLDPRGRRLYHPVGEIAG